MKKRCSIVKPLKTVVKRLQKSLLSGMKLFVEAEEFRVPKGHFAVIAEGEDDLKRFVVHMSFLAHPSFLRLLERAAEEYGFEQDGALRVPCRPAELQQVLAQAEEDGCGGDQLHAGVHAVKPRWSRAITSFIVRS